MKYLDEFSACGILAGRSNLNSCRHLMSFQFNDRKHSICFNLGGRPATWGECQSFKRVWRSSHTPAALLLFVSAGPRLVHHELLHVHLLGSVVRLPRRLSGQGVRPVRLRLGDPWGEDNVAFTNPFFQVVSSSNQAPNGKLHTSTRVCCHAAGFLSLNRLVKDPWRTCRTSFCFFNQTNEVSVSFCVWVSLLRSETDSWCSVSSLCSLTLSEAWSLCKLPL